MTKLTLTETTLVDLLVVGKSLAEDEIEQIKAFGGSYDVEQMAMNLIHAPIIATIRDAETHEPLVVGGFQRTGPTRFASFFLANSRVWEEHGAEVTDMTRQFIDDVKSQMRVGRLETYCLASREKARRWYEQIGLEFDYEIRGFGVNGESAVVYSTVVYPQVIEVPEPKLVGVH